MAKKKNNKHKHRNKHRNQSSPPKILAPSTPKKRNSRRIPRGETPTFWTAASAVAGGLGGAALGAWAGRKGYDPRWVGALMAGAGGLGAWKLGGNLRLASYGFAAAGAGDSLLKWLDQDHEKKGGDAENDNKGKGQLTDGKSEGKSESVAAAATNGARQSRNGGAGLDRAFNRVRERLHRIYEDDGEEGFVENQAA